MLYHIEMLQMQLNLGAKCCILMAGAPAVFCAVL